METGWNALPVLAHANQRMKTTRHEAATLQGSRHCQFHFELQNLSGKTARTNFVYPKFQK